MILTKKCEEDFLIWLNFDAGMKFSQRELFYNDRLTDSMKFGVYVDFFDALDIHVSVSHDGYSVTVNGRSTTRSCVSRKEARSGAIETANKIYNNL